jgi:RNA polymerase sigma-70 factor (ECF subfamily)
MKLSAQQFEQLALEQLDTLYRVAWRLVLDQSAVEDLVQETYLRALSARDGFSLEEYGIRPWLLRIMHNLFISRSQRQGRQPASMDDVQLEAAERPGADTLPIDPASFDAMDQRLVAALDELPPEYGSVMMLWAVEDMSYKEIALALDIPVGTVMSRLHRARKRLAGQLRPMAIDQRIIRE